MRSATVPVRWPGRCGTGETRTLGLVIPPMRHRLSAEQLYFVGAVADAAADHDYDILLSPSGGDREASFDKLVGERRVDGIVLMETGEAR